jgi:hypothetical protein
VNNKYFIFIFLHLLRATPFFAYGEEQPFFLKIVFPFLRFFAGGEAKKGKQGLLKANKNVIKVMFLLKRKKVFFQKTPFVFPYRR